MDPDSLSGAIPVRAPTLFMRRRSEHRLDVETRRTAMAVPGGYRFPVSMGEVFPASERRTTSPSRRNTFIEAVARPAEAPLRRHGSGSGQRGKPRRPRLLGPARPATVRTAWQNAVRAAPFAWALPRPAARG